MSTPLNPDITDSPHWGETDPRAWMAPGVGVTAVFDYKRKGCGSGTYRVFERNRETAQVKAEAKRDQYLAMHFDCTPILYRVGA